CKILDPGVFEKRTVAGGAAIAEAFLIEPGGFNAKLIVKRAFDCLNFMVFIVPDIDGSFVVAAFVEDGDHPFYPEENLSGVSDVDTHVHAANDCAGPGQQIRRDFTGRIARLSLRT